MLRHRPLALDAPRPFTVNRGTLAACRSHPVFTLHRTCFRTAITTLSANFCRAQVQQIAASRDASHLAPTGSPEAFARLRFPQNVACGFTAPRSSAVGSQHCQHLQFPVGETQFWFQQPSPLFDLVEGIPGEATTCPAAAAQHLSPVTFDDR